MMLDNKHNTERFVSKSETRHLAGNVSDMTLWRWERDGKFPRRIRLSHNKVVWRHSDILRWIDNCADLPAQE